MEDVKSAMKENYEAKCKMKTGNGPLYNSRTAT